MTSEWFTIARLAAEIAIGVFVFYFGLARKQQEQIWQRELAFRDQQIEALTERMSALRVRVDHGTSKCSERTGAIQKGIWEMTERLVRLETLLSDDRRQSHRRHEKGPNNG